MFVSMYKYKLSTNVHLLICLSIFSLVVTSGTSSQYYDVCNQTIGKTTLASHNNKIIMHADLMVAIYFLPDELQKNYATVSAELITADDGVTLLGIRVNWTINSTYSVCNISSLKVELNSGESTRKLKNITVNESGSSLDFINLDCNTQYTPRLISNISLTSSDCVTFGIVVNGTQILFGGISSTKFTKTS